MKDLLVKTNNWDRAFGDVDEVELNNGEDMVEENEDGKAKNDTLNEETTIISHEISELDDHECEEIIENLTNLEKEEVIDNAVKETICTYMHKTNTSNSDNRTSIPLYSQVTQREHKSGDKLIKSNSKFVETNHNEQLIFVRKLTLVWLFQEGKRVSADRLFRVRAKQPFSTPIQPSRPQSDFSVPEVREFIELGKFCGSQDVTAKEWSIVKVTQFANFKEKLKSNRQFKATKASVHSDAVGALCLWFVNKDKSHKFNYNNDRPIDYVPISKS